jgi:hypothetical protein
MISLLRILVLNCDNFSYKLLLIAQAEQFQNNIYSFLKVDKLFMNSYFKWCGEKNFQSHMEIFGFFDKFRC